MHLQLLSRRSALVRRVLCLVLVLCTMPMLSGCFTEQRYNKAVEHWDETAYAAAMNYFTKIPDHKDSAEYIQKFESDVTASLLETPWASEMTRGEHRWVYEFRQDGTVLYRIQEWDGGLKKYTDYVSKWELTYDEDEETRFYEAYVTIGSDRNYILRLGTAEDGTIVVNCMKGLVQDHLDTYDAFYYRDSPLNPAPTK